MVRVQNLILLFAAPNFIFQINDKVKMAITETSFPPMLLPGPGPGPQFSEVLQSLVLEKVPSEGS